jgi:hypothetical protein
MSNQTYIGSINKVDGDKIVFFLDGNAKLSFGQIVKIESGSRGFYARVVNAGSSSTLDTHEQLREAHGKESFGPYSSYKHVTAVLFLERTGEKLRAPTFNPNYMDKVYATEDEDCKILKLAGDLEIGLLRSGEQVLGKVGIGIEAIPLMIGMFGMTGSGKTNCELVVNAQLIDCSPKTVGLIFDFAGQLLEGKGIRPQRGLKDHPLFHTRAKYYSARDKKMTVGLYTLQPKKLGLLFPEIGGPQLKVAQKLCYTFGDQWIEQAKETYTNEGPQGIGKAINYKQRNVIEALMLKLLSLSPELFPPASYSFIDDVVQNITQGITCLIDISGMSNEEQQNITNLTAANVATHYKTMWEQNFEEWQKLPTLLITLEEAHEFLDPAKPKTIFSNIALTYRKYRVGLNAVTPRPSRITFDVFAELWTKVIMKTELSRDRLYVTENTPYLEYSDTELKMLDLGEALLISEPKIRFAVPVKITHYPEYLDERKPADHGLPDSQQLSDMERRIKQVSTQSSVGLQ